MPEPTPPSSSARRYVLLAIKLSVSIILLVVLFEKIDMTQLWATARLASVPWLLAAAAISFSSSVVAAWRWNLLLKTQQVEITLPSLFGTFLVSTYFNNFLPSNIGGDVIRITDTARHTNSKSVASFVVVLDGVLGVVGLALVAAIGATAIGPLHDTAAPIWPGWLWAGFATGVAVTVAALLAPDLPGRLLRPLTAIHPEWVGDRITTLTSVLTRFAAAPGTVVSAVLGAVVVQAALVLYYSAVAYALHLDVAIWDLAVVVPMSFVVQLMPVSVGGFGVREAFFSYYFHRIGQPIEDAIVMSLVAQVLLMLSSLSGLAVYIWRSRHPLKATRFAATAETR
jgi:uncharacterized membrane protein YbhN (UPF0104 family)